MQIDKRLRFFANREWNSFDEIALRGGEHGSTRGYPETS